MMKYSGRLPAYIGTIIHILFGILQLILVAVIFLLVAYKNGILYYLILLVIPLVIFSGIYLVKGFFALYGADTRPVSALEVPAAIISGIQVTLFVAFLFLRSFFDKPTEHATTIVASILYSVDMILVSPFLVVVFLYSRRSNTTTISGSGSQNTLV